MTHTHTHTPQDLSQTTYPHRLLFFTCATGFYSNFVAPYIYFAAKNNPSSAFEFILSDVDKFIQKHHKALEWLKTNLDLKIELRSVNEQKIKPKIDNSIRFVMEPRLRAEYVYIGDVDIMILEDILSIHSPIFSAGLPYSNVVRTGTKRLTGLHLCKSSLHYPLGDINDLVDTIINDEELLYSIVERKGQLGSEDIRNKLNVGRPIHGIHLSLNRLPFSFHTERVGWGLTHKWLQDFKQTAKSDEFKDFFHNLYQGSQSILINLVYLSEGNEVVGRERFGQLPY